MNYTRLVIEHKHTVEELQLELERVRDTGRRLELLRELIHFLQFNEPTVARLYAEQLLDFGLQKRNESDLGIAYNVFAIAEIEKGDFRSALLYSQQAMEVLEEYSEPFIVTCRNIAEIYVNQGNYIEALKHVQHSLHLQDVLRLKRYEAFTQAQLAKVSCRLGQHKEALEICFDALHKYRNTEVLGGWEAYIHHVLGLIYSARSEMQRALENYEKSLELWSALNRKSQMTGMCINIGGIYIRQKNLDLAYKYYEEALKIDRQGGGNIKMQGLIYQNLAVICEKKGDTKKGKEYYDFALNLARQSNDRLGEMQLLFNRAAMQGDEQPEEAILIFQRSLRIAEEINDERYMMLNYEGISEMHAKLNNHKEAYEALLNATKKKNSFFNVEKAKEIKKQETEFYEKLKNRALENLKNHNEELKHFVLRATDELTQPLQVIHDLASVLRGRYMKNLDDKGKKYLLHIEESAEHLNRLIGILVEYAVVGIQPVEAKKIDLNEVVNLAIRTFEQQILESGATINRGDLPTIWGDKKVIVSLFQHLIGNSLKFSRIGVPPKIEILSEESNDSYIILVKDNGIGIAAADRERVFEIFEKIHHSKSQQGDGIGLAICQKAMESMKGSIWLRSKVNVGTTVFLKFPKKISKI